MELQEGTLSRLGHKVFPKNSLIPVIIIAVLGFIAYGNSLKGEFLWDDNILVKDNAYIRNWSFLPNIFTEDLGSGAQYQYKSYRPIHLITHRVEYSLWKLNPLGYHLTNILLHILAALSLYWLVNILFRDKLLSLVTGALFIVHPIHTEAVAYISGRADPLATLFLLLTLIFYINHIRRGNIPLFFAMLASYILAVLSRENALILPFIMLLYHFIFKERIHLAPFLVITAAACAYLFFRFAALGGSFPHLTCTSAFLERLPGSFIALAEYVRLLFAPFGLHMEYGNGLFGFTDPRVYIGAAISVFLIFCAIREKDRAPVISFAVLWFIITLLPSLNLYPVTAFMAEHWLYMPSIGFFLAAAYFIRRFYENDKTKKIAVIILAAAILFYSYLTVRQNVYWRKEVSLYRKTLQYAEGSDRMFNNLGAVYTRTGRDKEAIPLFEKAIAIKPDNARGYNNLAVAYKNLGMYDKAMDYLEKALEIDPDFSETYTNMGAIYGMLGKPEKAVPYFKKAAELAPASHWAFYNLGTAYHASGNVSAAIAEYEKAVALNQDNTIAHQSLIKAYCQEGRYDLARRHCDKMRELGYNLEPDLLRQLGENEKRQK